MTKKLSLFILLILISTASEAAWLSPAKLTDNSAADQVPAISGDGKRIVYYSDEDGDNDNTVRHLYCIETKSLKI